MIRGGSHTSPHTPSSLCFHRLSGSTDSAGISSVKLRVKRNQFLNSHFYTQFQRWLSARSQEWPSASGSPGELRSLGVTWAVAVTMWHPTALPLPGTRALWAVMIKKWTVSVWFWWEHIHITQVQPFHSPSDWGGMTGQDASPRGRHELPRFQEALGVSGVGVQTEAWHNAQRLTSASPQTHWRRELQESTFCFLRRLNFTAIYTGTGTLLQAPPVPTSQWPASLGGTSKPSFSSSRCWYFSYCRYPAYPPPVATRMGRGRSRDKVRAGAVWTFLASATKNRKMLSQEKGQGWVMQTQHQQEGWGQPSAKLTRPQRSDKQE